MSSSEETVVQLSNGAWVDLEEFAYAQFIPQRYSTEDGGGDNPVPFVLVVFHTGVKTKVRVGSEEEGLALRDELGDRARAVRLAVQKMVERAVAAEEGRGKSNG